MYHCLVASNAIEAYDIVRMNVSQYFYTAALERTAAIAMGWGRGFENILGQKRNAAYKPYILYGGGGSFTNLSQTICHSLSADSCVIGPSCCPRYHCHRTKLIEQSTPTVLSILTSRHYTMTS